MFVRGFDAFNYHHNIMTELCRNRDGYLQELKALGRTFYNIVRLGL